MRRNTTAKLGLLLVALVVCLAGATTAGAALVFSNPLSYSTPGVVGTRDTDNNNSQNPDDILTYAQQILNVTGLGTVYEYDSADKKYIKLSTVKDYSGTLKADSYLKPEPLTFSVPVGWDYVAAKYDGPEAGIVLFYLGGQAATIPQYPYSFWTTKTEKYELSQWVAFKAVEPGPVVPEPTTILAGALLLLPCGASVLRALRRNRA